MGTRRTPEEDALAKEQATEMRLAGIGVKRIAKELHVSQEVVHALLVDVPPPSTHLRHRAKDEHREAAIALRREGRTYREIQEELGVSKGSLSLWLRELPQPSEEQRAALGTPEGTEVIDVTAGDRDVARALRLEGWLLKEIAEELGVTLKTACLWCNGLPIPARATHGNDRDQIVEAGRAYWAARRPVLEAERQAAVLVAQESVPTIDPVLLGLLAAVAYWCEGSKSKPWAKKERLTIINQDPDVIRLWMCWLRAVEVDPERISFRLSIHESADAEAAARYWGLVVGAAPESFARPTLKRHKPSTVRHNTGGTYHGCLVVDVRLSRDLYRFIEGTWRGIVRNALAGADRARA